MSSNFIKWHSNIPHSAPFKAKKGCIDRKSKTFACYRTWRYFYWPLGLPLANPIYFLFYFVLMFCVAFVSFLSCDRIDPTFCWLFLIALGSFLRVVSGIDQNKRFSSYFFDRKISQNKMLENRSFISLQLLL